MKLITSKTKIIKTQISSLPNYLTSFTVICALGMIHLYHLNGSDASGWGVTALPSCLHTNGLKSATKGVFTHRNGQML